ncbi:MAG: SRPBCC family protein [Dermatophilaceae bacterium]
MVRFEVLTAIAAPPQRVFDLSLDIDLHTASMARSGERAVGGITSGRMTLGDAVTWRARHGGIHWRMTSVISAYDAPRYFVDEQVAGPFAHWRHAHHLDPDGNDGTIMRDVVDFAAPLGLLGVLAERIVLRWYMPRLIRSRNNHLKAVAETS